MIIKATVLRLIELVPMIIPLIEIESSNHHVGFAGSRALLLDRTHF